MNPSDALPEDRRMYYHGCWMKHAKLGIGLVHVEDSNMYFYTFPDDRPESDPAKVNPRDLTCWWPRPGAYNTPKGAMYISRKAVRTMRKSANPMEHYFVKWGGGRQTKEIMLIMRKGPEHHDLNYALKIIKDDLSAGVAITRDIILTKGKFGEIQVIFRGLVAGEYRNGEFIPTFNGSPLAKRVMYKLAREELR